nr:hypothetical protein CFP56_73946 [Quercus suber]
MCLQNTHDLLGIAIPGPWVFFPRAAADDLARVVLVDADRAAHCQVVRNSASRVCMQMIPGSRSGPCDRQGFAALYAANGILYGKARILGAVPSLDMRASLDIVDLPVRSAAACIISAPDAMLFGENKGESPLTRRTVLLRSK